MSEDRRPGTGSERVRAPEAADLGAPGGDGARSRGAGSSSPSTETLPLSGAGGSTAVDDRDGRPAGGREAVPGRPAPARPARSDARPPVPSRPGAARRRARLAISRIDPWSVFVTTLLISIFLGIVLVVAVFVLYGLLDQLGVLDSVNSFARDLQIIHANASVVNKGQVLGVSVVLAAVDVVLLTVLATLGAFLYNVCASLTGGIEVALAERE